MSTCQRTHHKTGCKLPNYEWLYHLRHKASANPSTSWASPSSLVTPRTEDNAEAIDLAEACVLVTRRHNFLTPLLDSSFLMEAHNEHTAKVVKKKIDQLLHTHSCSHKSQCLHKGSDGLKEDPAGYYGMPGICWGNIGLPVWARRAWSVWIALFHSLSFLPTSVKRFGRRKEKKETWRGGVWGTRDECVELLKRDGCVCVCCWGRGSVLSSSALIQH